VTGIHPSLTEEDVTRLFEKYGEVEKCNIMRDPHSKESRGFGFVKMVTPEQADAAKEGLQGEVHQGRTLSIEKARRARPRTPTPGKYYGPPKRGECVPFPTIATWHADSTQRVRRPWRPSWRREVW
jgi:RNA recognition motif-containing protein